MRALADRPAGIEASPAPHRAAVRSLAAKVAFLSRPESYPDRPTRVETIETHMSWVFLTDRHAWKLKKPVRYEHLDFRTPERRRRSCEEEVRLNRRLAPDVYLGVERLGLAAPGVLALGAARAVDWLVLMRRLPRERTLECAIRDGWLRRADTLALARMLGEFYARGFPVRVSPAAYRRRFTRDVQANADALARRAPDLPMDRVGRVTALQSAFLERRGALLERRAAERRIVEAHGDLRPEHVFLDGAPLIIDCLEFHRPFRLLDPADELAFLSMECDRLGAAEVGADLFAVYADVTGDRPPPALVGFYKGHRACIRARLAIAHLHDEVVPDPDKWRRLAAAYLERAERELSDALAAAGSVA